MNVSLRTWLTGACALLTGLLLVMAGAAIAGVSAVGASTQDIVGEHAASLLYVSQVENEAQALAGTALSYVVSAGVERTALETRMVASAVAAGRSLEALGPVMTTDEERSLFGELRDSLKAVDAARVKLMQRMQSDDGAAQVGPLVATELAPALDRLQRAARRTMDLQREQMSDEAEVVRQQSERLRTGLLLLAGVALLVSGLVHRWIGHAVNRPITMLTALLGRIAERDLTVRMEGAYHGEFASVQASVNQMSEAMGQALAQTMAGATEVAVGASRIAVGSQRLAENASEQAATLEEVTASLQQIEGLVAETAGTAQGMQQAATQNDERVSQGMASMERLSSAMLEIRRSAEATTKVLQTINSIASQTNLLALQTNLLALNAAVEAARAGAAGKGFAVVADEVRNLARHSAEAARDTELLIAESTRHAEVGVRLNEEVLAQLRDVVANAHHTSGLAEQVAGATAHQRQVVQEISSALEQLNVVTQQTAGHAQESAAVAQELSGQSQQALDLVADFTIPGLAGVQRPEPTHLVAKRPRAGAALRRAS